ncbi:MAG: phage portal protein [Rikenellaceae bacterium]
MSWLSNFIPSLQRRSASEEIDAAVSRVLSEMNNSDVHHKGSMTINQSLGLSAVWACVRILSETVGILPVHLYKRSATGREKDRNHPAIKIVNYPNDYSGRFSTMQTLIMHLMLWGNGYMRIYRNRSMRPIELEILHPSTVEPYLTDDRQVLYYLDNGTVLDSDDVIHIKNLSTNGIKGKSPIAVHRDNLNLAKAAQDYGEKFFTQGGNTSGVYKIPTTLKDDQYKRLVEGLARRSAGIDNAHKPLVLEAGLDYQRISIPPEDAQFIQTRTFEKTEIATIFGVPPHMIADLERSTNNNIEHQGMEYVTYCLMPYLIRLEEEFNRKLLRYDEQDVYYFKFSLKAILRGDMKTRTESYKNLFYIGAMTPNEIRELEDLNRYEGGDEYYTQTNMQTVTFTQNPQK